MAGQMEPALRDHIHRDLRRGLESMVKFVGSLAADDAVLLGIQASNSWCNLDRVSSQLHTMQAGNERMQQVLATYIKWAKDETTEISKEIATLDGFVAVSCDEQTELEAQAEQAKHLLEKCSKHLHEAEEQLKRKTAQNWRIASVFTNALANSEIEAKKALKQMAHFSSNHASRHEATTKKKRESLEAIAVARSKHEHLVNTELCGKLEELDLLKSCHQSEKHVAEELKVMTAILDPITIYCQVLCEVCQHFPADPMLIQPVLEELGGALDRCDTKEAQALYTVQRERENLQTLAGTVQSLQQSNAIPALGFEDCSFAGVELPVTDENNYDYRCLTDGSDDSYVNAILDDLVDSDDETSCSGPLSRAIPGATSSGAMSCDLSCESDSDGALVAPEPQHMQSIQTCISSMQTLSRAGDDTDFSLSEFPPTDGFDYLHWPSSFQASIIQLESAWWACMTATRNAFLMFQLYSRLTVVCLIQADQTLQMGRGEDLELYINKTLPVLEKISQQMNDIAKHIESNFTTVNGIVSELTETCTVASGQAGMNQRELSITEKVNQKESETTDAQIKELIQKRKKMAESIQRAEEEFAKVILELPGVFNLLTTTATDRCTSALHNVSRFFRKASEKALNLDVFGFFKTCGKEIKGLGKMIGDWFTGVDDDSDEPISYGEEKAGSKDTEEEDASKEMIVYLKVIQIKAAVELMTQMLLDQGNLNVQRSNDTVWEAQATLGANKRALRKSGKYSELEVIVSSLLNICQTVLDESRSMSPSQETYQQVMGDLTDAQQSLELMSRTMKSKLESLVPEENKSPTQESPKQSHHRGFMVLERVANERFARGRKLHTLCKSYDRQTENITSCFEAQKETAEILSQLTVELNQLGKTLDLMSQAAVHLTNLQRNLEAVNRFTQQVSNVIQNSLSPKINKVVTQMTRCLETVKKSENNRISRLQENMIRKEIQEAGRTAKSVYDCSKSFVEH